MTTRTTSGEDRLAGSIRALLVEDNPGDARLIRELLRDVPGQRFELVVAATLSEARERLARSKLDLVLLDLGLPDSSGIDTVTQVHAAAPDLPIVVLSGSRDEELALRSVQARAQDYLVKGEIDAERLARMLRQAIERRRQELRAAEDLRQQNEELRVVNHQLRRLVDVDPLTEMLNRRGLERVLRSEVSRLRRGGSSMMACLLDCDDFKRVNDTWGHDAGDALLREVAHRLTDCVRPSDHVGRLGGDEFLVFLPHAGFEEGMRVAERLRRTVCALPIHLPSGKASVTVSLGMGPVTAELASIEQVIAAGDGALQRSKLAGKNRISIARGDPPARRRANAPAELGRLFRSQGLRAVCMPVVRIEGEGVQGYEFLSRGAPGALELPEEFFRASRQHNLQTPLDLRCLAVCLRAASTLAGQEDRRFYLNLFPSTILETPIDHLLAVFSESAIVERVCVELSEQQFEGEPGTLRQPLAALRRAGLSLALDDVGCGSSPIENLVLLEPDILKLDGRVVHGCARTEASQVALKRLADVSAALGAEVVAEGVESREDLEFLRSIGIPYAQGFLWGKPQEIAAAAK